ncbi:ABC transporter substrate-binding protein [Rhizobium rhizogenes]|uniref:ABC transporter substrate-binding protein n=1 Tax=Rhizobium rhizogenes NBRC 13257 TaxID=1220581 RepID=A0AA87U6Y1_RHIRH|nr:ABC transporter substrate-binding protein [Rhizobium rhizogenes]NTG71495.1 ABC transporter substrate-binding protein [Rhizobium rhizogenes]NTG90591.1 ABC transporter substrate-binding protein [Rhizobium rhizogenes]TRB03414.1 ABC transporter substrate-binding protein [Rhizobium rhizogenes]TRB38156.1 ABC transporter substrate-binding protein [Rhizobium rhizogenes]TRB53167.1 ABC transporter substrate-binding protein [Rhizobium rhizogenes]
MGTSTRFRSAALGAAAVLITLFTGGAAPVVAQELRIATSYKLMTLDPHYSTLNENSSLLSQIYERLVYQDEKFNLKPDLATSWQRLSDTRWEFKLRENVRFHDGSPFTSEDVIYSINRIQAFLKPPGGGFQPYTKAIKSVSAPDPRTVIFDTNGSQPTLPLSLSSIFIMPKSASGFKTTDDLNGGVPPIGTGPYKFKSWRSGEVLELTRNEDYWGGRPSWSDVTFRIIESPAARVAALSTNDVDIADFIPARDVPSLKQHGFKVANISAARVNFVQFDLASDKAPGVTNKAGEPIPNPFRDPRVRRALSMVVDRGVLVDKILSGFGTAAAQVFPQGLPGTSPYLTAGPPRYPEAKALLAEAGYPKGFNVVLAGPTGRYPGDAESLQAIAQNWARIGVGVQPVAVPFSVFNTKRAVGEYGIWYGGGSGESVDILLDALVASPNSQRGTGALNYGKYMNHAFDEMLIKAETLEVGPDRDKALADATEFVMRDQPIIPLYHFDHLFGYGARVASYTMHPRGWTTAMQAAPTAR